MQATFTTDSTGKLIAWPVNAYYYQSNGISVLYTTHATNEGDDADDYACAGNGDVSSNICRGRLDRTALADERI